MRVLVTSALLAAGAARAQGPGSEAGVVLILGPPTLISVALDVTLLSSLVTEGDAPRGRSITTVVFGGISLLFSLGCLAAGLGSASRDTTWTAISAGGLAFAIGTLAVAIYALTRPAPEAEPEPQREPEKQYENLYRPPPAKPQEIPDQL